MKAKLIYIFSVFLIFASCTKTVEYPVEASIRRPVVFSFINQNEVSIQLFWSRLVTESSNFTSIDNASVLLYEDDVLIGSLTFVSNGKYQNENIGAKEGHDYKIVINVPDYGEVSATTKMPYRVNPDFSLVKNEESSNIELNQIFADPANEDNYYYTSAKALIYFGDSIVDTTFNFNFSSPMYNNFYNNNGSIFHDRLIRGQSYNCLVKISENSFSYRDLINHTSIYCDSAKIIPTFQMINFDIYQYFVDVDMQKYSNDNAFAEPYPIYSNIIGGYGIFGAYYEITDSLIFIPN